MICRLDRISIGLTRQRKPDIAHGDAAGRRHFLSAHCQSKLVACKSGEKQVFEDADMRQECGWQHCRPLPLGLFISVYHTRPLSSWRTKDAINACRDDQRITELKEHMLLNLHRSPSTVQTTDLVATNE